MRREPELGLQLVDRVAEPGDLPEDPLPAPPLGLGHEFDIELAQARARPLDHLPHEFGEVSERRDVPPRVLDRPEPPQDREIRPARVVERSAGLGAAGEELLAEPGEVSDPVLAGLLGEGLGVERLCGRRGAGAGAHQGQRVGPVPGQDLEGRLHVKADELCVQGRHDDGRQDPVSPGHAHRTDPLDAGCQGGRGLGGGRRRHEGDSRGPDRDDEERIAQTHQNCSDLRTDDHVVCSAGSGVSVLGGHPTRASHFAEPAGAASGTIRKSTCPSRTTAPGPIGAS